jgi:hypothetical protein
MPYGHLSKVSLPVRVEGIALELWVGVGAPAPPVSAVALADALGLAVKVGFPDQPGRLAMKMRGRLDADRGLIEVSEALSGRELHDVVAHELGHWALREFSARQSESAADAVAAALMLPLRYMGADVGLPMDRLLSRHIHCSERLARVRLKSLARVSWWPRAP